MISIDRLPDDALLVIFDHYINDLRYPGERKLREKAWQSLVHVCRRWRGIVFESPRQLDLQLICTGETPVRDKLDVWPALPLFILVDIGDSIRSADNIVAALERTDRVCQINFVNVQSSDMEIFLAAMQQPFSELTNLRLWLADEVNETVVVSDSFLGGSTSHLGLLSLSHIPFPGLPKLLLTATHLRSLLLQSIPHSGYFSPDAIATVLSTLTSLRYLDLKFQSPRSCPDRASRRPPPSTRSVLPVLTTFDFKGVSEYLEDLVAFIDAPKLGRLTITFFNDIVFDAPQLIRFISCAPKLKALEKANIYIYRHAASVKFSSQTYRNRVLKVEIFCKGLDWQLSSLEQVCTSCLPPLSMSENLYFYEAPDSQLDGQDSIDNDLWLELLRPFSAVKSLYLSEKVAPRIAPALQELSGGRTTEALPTLQNIFLEKLESSGPVKEGIGRFVAARQVVAQPIAVSRWERDRLY